MPDLNPDARVYQLDSQGKEFGDPAPCLWFALCENPANGLRRGPVGNGEFGPIPICKRCDDRLERMSA